MTYADMITLLLCFFVTFLIVSAAHKGAPQIAPAPRMMEVTEHLPPAVKQPDTRPSPPEPAAVVLDALEEPLPGRHSAQDGRPAKDTANEVLAKIDAPPLPASANAGAADADPVKAEAASPQVPVIIPPPSLAEIVDTLKSQNTAAVEQKGDRISTLEISSAAFFDSGSAAVSDAGKSILRKVAVNLKSDISQGYRITVEGHTDDTPINTAQFPSNWELSTARAAAVVHFFLDQGIPAERLRAAGYADTFPKAPNRDANGNAIPENQAQNRRVVIKLEKIEKTGAR